MKCNNQCKKIRRDVVAAVVIWVALIGYAVTADAGNNHNVECYQCVTNYTTEVNEIENWSLTDSLSDGDMNDIIGSTLAGGSHQFDWVTTRWQLSITGATTTSDWDSDTNFSFAIGKKFGKDSWVPNALWHVGFTPDIYDGNDYVHGGATILLGGGN